MAAEVPIQWTDDLWTLHAHMSTAQDVFDASVADIVAATGATNVIVALSDASNFRYRVYPRYKHNRKDKRPPLLRAALKEYVQARYDCFLRPDLEGDDVLGILSTSPHIVKGDKIIVSTDKDMKTVPGKLYNSGWKEYSEITERAADYHHLMQTLTGDATDGYPGCPGIGPKRAEAILSGMLKDDAPVADYWSKVVATYEKAGLSEEYALTQARVARICRADYDFKKKEVILWTP